MSKNLVAEQIRRVRGLLAREYPRGWRLYWMPPYISMPPYHVQVDFLDEAEEVPTADSYARWQMDLIVLRDTDDEVVLRGIREVAAEYTKEWNA